MLHLKVAFLCCLGLSCFVRVYAGIAVPGANHQFVDRWLAANAARSDQFQQKDVRADHAAYDLLGIDGDERFEYRVVFWFDN